LSGDIAASEWGFHHSVVAGSRFDHEVVLAPDGSRGEQSISRFRSQRQSMMRKSVKRFSLATNANAFARRSCSSKDLKRDDNSSKSHRALGNKWGPTAQGEDWFTMIPRIGDRFVGVPAKEPVQGITEAEMWAVEYRPSAAVLPFVNPGSEKAQEYLAVGIAEDVIAALMRFRRLFVFARNSSLPHKSKSIDAK
jgi:hypothetical protein